MRLRLSSTLKCIFLLLLTTTQPTQLFAALNVGSSPSCGKNNKDKCGEPARLKTSICPGLSNVEGDSTTANRFFLFEQHADRNEQGIRPVNPVVTKCIDKITSGVGPHVILVEGSPAGQVTPCKKHGIKNKKGRTCVKWDDGNAIKELDDAVLDLVLTHSKTDKVPKKFEDKLSKINLKREESLMKILSQHSGIFSVAVAGDGHKSDYVLNELRKGKDQNPFAILAMTS